MSARSADRCSPSLRAAAQLAGALGLGLLASGCSPEEVDKLVTGLLLFAILGVILMIVAAVLAFAWFAFQLVVIVTNFTRPAPWSMITGYVLGGLQALSGVVAIVAVVWTALSESAEAAPDVASLGGAVLWGGLMGGLLIASSWSAQKKLAADKAGDPL